MKKHRWSVGPLAVAFSVGVATMAGAQFPPGPPPNGADQPGQPPRQRPNFRTMTPEQRQQFMQQRREQNLRRTLQGSGFNDQALQDAVVAVAKQQDQSTQVLQEQSLKLIEALSTPQTSEAQLTTLLESFRTAAATEKERRKTAQAALDTQINYSTQPRLAALLTTMGLIGDEMTVVGGTGAMMGGPGGFGGRGGGGRGGRGGGGGGGVEGGRGLPNL